MLVMSVSLIAAQSRQVDKEASGPTFRAIRPNVKKREAIGAFWRRTLAGRSETRGSFCGAVAARNETIDGADRDDACGRHSYKEPLNA